MNTGLWIAVAAALLCSYFAACHIALKTFSRKRLIDLLQERGRYEANAARVERHASLMLATGMVRAGLNLVVVLATLDAMSRRFGDDRVVVYALTFLIAGALISVLAVAAPSSWALYSRERLLAPSLGLLDLISKALWPLVAVLHGLDLIIRRLFAVKDPTQQESDIGDEIMVTVEDHGSADDIDQTQKEMLENVVELSDTQAGEVMTPRTDVHGIEAGASLDEVKQAVQEFGHSRIPVYAEDLDHVVGILYVKDLIRYLGDGAEFELKQVLRQPFMVPETKSVGELLSEFKSRKVHLAIVLDEYGGTAGLVTIEDILEEIVGEIQDEYEGQEELPGVHRLADGAFDVDGRVYIDDLNDEIKLTLPEDDDYDTVGGFVFSSLGHIPQAGESFTHHTARFTVTETERTRVSRVRIDLIDEAVAAAPESGNGKAH